MELGDTLLRLGVALALGLIVGLQRERTKSPLAGFRTFPLVTLFGALSGLLAEQYSGWVIAGGLVAMAAAIVVGNLEPREERPGLTTEMAMLVMYTVGAFVVAGPMAVAAAVGGTVAVLLHLKPQMHSVARRLEDPDFKAIMQFVLIAVVILPILPQRGYGPFNVLNPFKIGLMVVLIVGISLGAYIVYKFFGQKAGTLAGGILGGLISSTATTVSYARRSKDSPESSAVAALVIMLASTIVFARLLVIISASAPAFIPDAAGPIGTVLGALLVVSLLYWRMTRKGSAQMPQHGNPSELKAALVFAALYALVLLAVAAARHYYGSQGLYVVSVLSGLTDMDAITLSLSELVSREEVSGRMGWQLILIAALSNLLFKAGTVAALGSRQLLWRVAILFAIAFLIATLVIVFWPGQSA